MTRGVACIYCSFFVILIFFIREAVEAMSATFSVVILLLHSLSSGSPAIIGEEDVIGDGPHFDLFDFPFADPVMWAADSGNASDDLGGFQGEKSPV